MLIKLLKQRFIEKMTKTEIALRNCEFAFRCKENWDEMMPTRDDGSARFCLDCMKEVFYCKTDDELIKNVRLNHCVAITKVVRSRPVMLLGIPIVRKK